MRIWRYCEASRWPDVIIPRFTDEEHPSERAIAFDRAA
jgi:hypothetical protein